LRLGRLRLSAAGRAAGCRPGEDPKGRATVPRRPVAQRDVGRMLQQPTPKAGSDGREHHQHRTDPEEPQREATRAVLVGRAAGASIAASHRIANQEPGCHQGNAEHLDDATHVSSLQVRVAHDAHLTPSWARPDSWPAPGNTSPMVAEPSSNTCKQAASETTASVNGQITAPEGRATPDGDQRAMLAVQPYWIITAPRFDNTYHKPRSTQHPGPGRPSDHRRHQQFLPLIGPVLPAAVGQFLTRSSSLDGSLQGSPLDGSLNPSLDGSLRG
jgi:hypothetical protein